MSIFVNAAGHHTWFDQTSVSVVLVPTTAQVIFMFIFQIFVLCQFLHRKFTNFTFHIIICTQISKYPNGCYLHTIIMHRTVIASIITNFTLLSISSFVHKYPNIQNVNILSLFLHHCKCPFLSVQLDARLGLTKLRFLWSWCLPQFLHKKFTNFTFHIIICTQISKYPNGCYLHMIIMHTTVIASIIKAITVLCV